MHTKVMLVLSKMKHSFIYVFIYLSIYLVIHLSIYLFIYLSIYLLIHLRCQILDARWNSVSEPKLTHFKVLQ